MNKNMIIYYHPTFGDSTLFFHSEDEALEFGASWANTCVMGIPLLGESLTVVFD